MMFALNFVAVRFSLKFLLSHFLIYKSNSTNAYRYLTSERTESLDFSSRKEERGAGGGTAWRMNAVPSPGHKKAKKFNLNQGIANILNSTRSPFLSIKSDILPHRLQTVSAALKFDAQHRCA